MDTLLSRLRIIKNLAIAPIKWSHRFFRNRWSGLFWQFFCFAIALNRLEPNRVKLHARHAQLKSSTPYAGSRHTFCFVIIWWVMLMTHLSSHRWCVIWLSSCISYRWIEQFLELQYWLKISNMYKYGRYSFKWVSELRTLLLERSKSKQIFTDFNQKWLAYRLHCCLL